MAKSQPKKQRSKQEIVEQIKYNSAISSNKGRVTIGWCDGGTVEGRFASSIVNTVLEAQRKGINVASTIRVQGNQIGRQRQSLFDYWADNMDSEWLMWVDSDIVFTLQAFEMLWETANVEEKPVVVGTYFVSSENEQTLMEPVAALYYDTDDQHKTRPIHPLPRNQVIPIDVAGFGLTLMHRSIVPKMRAVSGEYSLFGEMQKPGNKFISEDVSFFRKLKQAGIQLYAHTGAHAQHLKTFSFDINYYDMYWTGVAEGKIKRKQELVELRQQSNQGSSN